jgi:hypothetical protein
MYSYARSSLIQYATWMLDWEIPYFDHPEKLQYPTEAWAAQEFRKANVLRLAAPYGPDRLSSRFLWRGKELAEHAWQTLLRFESRTVTRAIALLMIEGSKDSFFRAMPLKEEPHSKTEWEFGQPEQFLYQKARVVARLKTAQGLAWTIRRLLDPHQWWRLRYWPFR